MTNALVRYVCKVDPPRTEANSLDYVQLHSDVEIFRFGNWPVKLGGTELCGFPVDE